MRCSMILASSKFMISVLLLDTATLSHFSGTPGAVKQRRSYNPTKAMRAMEKCVV